MEDYREKMIIEAANFLYQYKIPTSFLLRLINESLDAKKDISEKLDLYQDNNFRVSMPAPVHYGDNKEIDRFISRIIDLKNIETGYPWALIDLVYLQDQKKNKFKFTRIVQSMWNYLVLYKETQVVLELAGLWTQDCLDLSTGRRSQLQESTIKNLNAKFPVWYGDQIKNGRSVVISANPLDLLRASSNCSFQSCYRPDGEQFNGTISNMLSKNVIMITVEDEKKPGYKIGRSWFYVSDQIILPARKYGGIVDSHQLHARNYVERKLGGEWILLSGESLGSKWIDTQGPSYVDNGTGFVVINKAERERYKKIVIPKALCLYCGKLHCDCSRMGVCKSCFESVVSKGTQFD
jgi:hypothetical protein